MRVDNNFINDGFKHHLAAKIMVIDDLPLNLAIIKDTLEENGYHRVTCLQESTSALQMIEESRPDLLLVDLIMPEVSGFDLLKTIRQHPTHKFLPVIILTATEEQQNKLQALSLGATDYLTKPVDKMELCMRVRNILFAKAYQNQLAYYDALTQLPNKQMFLDDLAWLLKAAKRHGDRVALLSIEIDNFDNINNTVGLQAGDAVLRLVATRIQNVIRDSDLLVHLINTDAAQAKLFHLERNIFSLLLDRVQETESVVLVAERIIQAIRSTMHVEGSEYYVSASIGISIFPNEGEDLPNLLSLASSARDYVKYQGGNGFQFSSKEINALYEKRLNLDVKLRNALEKNQFILHYQPKIDFSNGRICGAEALVRWQVDNELLYPEQFLTHAEETGLIVPLGEWCLLEACKQLRAWHQSGNRINLAVNLSVKQLAQKGFLANLKEIILESRIDPNYLTLELTEHFLIHDIDEKIELFNQIRTLGMQLSIDDFGTGYSSLNYLRKLPLDELKIDRSFISEVTQNENSQAIVSTIVFLAKSLKLATVAEGIESRAEHDFMLNLHCSAFQGFLFSKAVPPAQFARLLATQ